jgi:hypothetical protein
MMRYLNAGLLMVALFGAMECPWSVQCDEHGGVVATYVRDEYPNGQHYRVYGHYVGSARHELKMKCD